MPLLASGRSSKLGEKTEAILLQRLSEKGQAVTVGPDREPIRSARSARTGTSRAHSRGSAWRCGAASKVGVKETNQTSGCPEPRSSREEGPVPTPTPLCDGISAKWLGCLLTSPLLRLPHLSE